MSPFESMVPTAQGKQGKQTQQLPVRKSSRNLESLPKHREFTKNAGNLVCKSLKFPDSKDQGCCDICREITLFFLTRTECVGNLY